jgi:hypothetical protein
MAIPLCGFDYREANAILDRATGILRFKLEKELADAGVETGHLEQRCVADQAQHRWPGKW